MNTIDRNKILVRHLISAGIVANQKDLGNKLGYSNESSFSQIINCKVPFPKDFILKLKKIEPRLNTEWLINGRGEMLNPITQSGNGINTGVINNSIIDNRQYYSDSPEVLRAEIDKLDRIISEKEARIAEKDKQIAEKDKQIAALIAAISR